VCCSFNYSTQAGSQTLFLTGEAQHVKCLIEMKGK